MQPDFIAMASENIPNALADLNFFRAKTWFFRGRGFEVWFWYLDIKFGRNLDIVYLIFSYHNCSYQPEIATNDGSSRIFRTSNILRPRKSEPIHQDSPTQFPRSVSQKLHVGRSIENLQHVGCKKNFQTRKTEPTHQGFLTGPIKKKSELETRT